MTVFLRYKHDRNEPQKMREQPFENEGLAVSHAAIVLAQGTGWDLEILDDKRDTLLSDSEIRARCKSTRIP